MLYSIRQISDLYTCFNAAKYCFPNPAAVPYSHLSEPEHFPPAGRSPDSRPGLMKTDDPRKPCHLGYLEQRVVIVFRRTEIQIHHNTPQSLNISVLYIVRFSFANRFRERTLYVEILPHPAFNPRRCFSCKYRWHCPLCRRLLYASANVSATCRANREFPR